MKKLSEYAAIIIAVFTLAGMVVAGLTYFATANDLEIVSQRLDNKIIGDTIQQISERIWSLEKKHDYKPIQEWNDEDDIREYRNLKLQLDELRKKQGALLEKGA